MWICLRRSLVRRTTKYWKCHADCTLSSGQWWPLAGTTFPFAKNPISSSWPRLLNCYYAVAFLKPHKTPSGSFLLSSFFYRWGNWSLTILTLLRSHNQQEQTWFWVRLSSFRVYAPTTTYGVALGWRTGEACKQIKANEYVRIILWNYLRN